jgi:hypothetical protein
VAVPALIILAQPGSRASQHPQSRHRLRHFRDPSTPSPTALFLFRFGPGNVRSLSRKSALAPIISAWSRKNSAVSANSPGAASEFMVLDCASHLVVHQMVGWETDSPESDGEEGSGPCWICIHPYRGPPLPYFSVAWH